MATLLSILNFILIIVVIIAGYFIKQYFPAYFREKAKNLATKEDVKEITNQVESIKLQYSKELEALKAKLGSQLFVHQTRYQNEFDILKDLSEKLVLLRDTALNLRPEAEYINTNESEDDRKKRKLEKYNKIEHELYQFFESRKPFYPDNIYEGVKTLDKVVWKEVVQYKNRSYQGKRYDPEYWEKAEANNKVISEKADRLIELIRQRIKSWESLNI